MARDVRSSSSDSSGLLASKVGASASAISSPVRESITTTTPLSAPYCCTVWLSTRWENHCRSTSMVVVSGVPFFAGTTVFSPSGIRLPPPDW